jgi:hypothetical protein
MITQQELKSLLHYDPVTGVFTWLPRQSKSFNTQKAGKEAGTIKVQGRHECRRINVGGKLYYAHRLAWLYVHGKFPDDEIDHINGNALDNRMINMRDVSKVENCRNMPHRSASNSKLLGVTWNNQYSMWKVQIADRHPTRKGRKFIGHFRDFFEACCARKRAELFYNYHPNHGRP